MPMRFLFRFLSLLALAVAVIAGTVDAIRSVAAGRVLLTPLGAAWAEVSAGSLESLRSLAETKAPSAGTPLLQWLLAQPAFAVLLAIALLLYCIGYRRPRTVHRSLARWR